MRDRSQSVNLRIPRQLWEELEPHAAYENRSTASMANNLIARGLREYEAELKKIRKPKRGR